MKILHLRPEAWQFKRKRLELRKYKAKHSDLYTARWRPGPATMVDQPMRHIKFEIVVIQNLYIYIIIRRSKYVSKTRSGALWPQQWWEYGSLSCKKVEPCVSAVAWLHKARKCVSLTKESHKNHSRYSEVSPPKSAVACLVAKTRKFCMNGQGMLVGSSAFWVIGYFVTPTHRARTREKRRRSQSFLLARTTKQWRKSMSHKKAGK